MSRFRLTLLALTTTALIACDDSPATTELDFRNGDPEVLYLSQDNSNINIPKFADLVVACEKAEKVKLALTWTAHTPEPTGSKRVLGLSFSTLAGEELIGCYEALMIKLGATPLP